MKNIAQTLAVLLLGVVAFAQEKKPSADVICVPSDSRDPIIKADDIRPLTHKNGSRSSSTVAKKVDDNIRQVDFKNLSYPWAEYSGWPHALEWQDKSEKQQVRLVNGREPQEAADEPFSGLTLESVHYADVTGDGKADALVVLRYDTGGTQYSHYVYVYSMVAGKPTLLAYFHSGDRAASGLYRVYGQQGKLVIELYDPNKAMGDCCSTGFVRTRYQWQNGRFTRVGAPESGTVKNESRIPVTVFGTHQ